MQPDPKIIAVFFGGVFFFWFFFFFSNFSYANIDALPGFFGAFHTASHVAQG